ncbi:MAG: DUF434 domain-containing protein [Candidatus Bathyarchaeia archaeon]
MKSNKVLEAIRDLRYLLARGYNRETSLKFVSDKYQLLKLEKMMLYRAVYDYGKAKIHRAKLIKPEEAKDKEIVIDGYNVIITLESGLKGKKLIECDDGFVRDISAIHGKHKITKFTFKAINLIMKELKEIGPKNTIFVFDSQVSKSGELASFIRKKLVETGVKGTAYTVKKADVFSLSFGNIIASSDAVIIEKAYKILDLAGIILKDRLKSNKIISIKNS